MNEVQTLSTDINVITAEINAYQRVAGEAIFEIGRRLHEVKYNPKNFSLPEGVDKEGRTIVARGAWGDFLTQANTHERQAQRLIKVFKRFSTTSLSDPGVVLPKELRVLDVLTEYDDEELIEPREMPDGSTKTLLEMSRREVEEFKREMKKAQERAERAEKAAEKAENMSEQERQRAQQESDKRKKVEQQLETLKKPETITIEKEVERVVEVDKTDYKSVERLKQYEERFGALENYSERVRATNVSDATTAIVSFNMAVRDFIKRHAFLIKYNDTIQYVDQVTQREYNEAVQALKEISADFSKVTGIGDFVDVEYTEVRQ